jgi:multidrug transporter EmrE-like cation transporter
LLVFVGLIFFHEQLSGKNAVGIVLCLAGLALITKP